MYVHDLMKVATLALVAEVQWISSCTTLQTGFLVAKLMSMVTEKLPADV